MSKDKQGGEMVRRLFYNLAVVTVFMADAFFLCLLLSNTVGDDSSFAVPIYLLAVAMISRFTSGYWYGILASVLGVVLVNTVFTYPYWVFDLSIAGYPLTFAVMLTVSSMISALTTQVKKQEQLRFEAEKEKMRANLLRSVSHDLRTPLASIQGASSTLLENASLPRQQQEELLREIDQDARWLTRVTENILSVTKFTGKQVGLKKNEEVMEEIVSSAIVKFRRGHASLPVTVEKPKDILLVPMDATLIEQVLLNLLENVACHAQTATCIKVRIQPQPGRVVVSVADNGVGIAPARLAHIFDGYGELVDQKAAADNGRRNMGLGLSVCSAIMYAHDGGIWAENNKQGGATFSFWLPCDQEEQEDLDE